MSAAIPLLALYALMALTGKTLPFVQEVGRIASIHSSVHPLSIHPPAILSFTRPSTQTPTQSSNHRSRCVHSAGRNAMQKTRERTGLLLAYVPTQEILLDLRGASRSVKCSRKCHQIHCSSLNIMALRYSCFANAVCVAPLPSHQTMAYQQI